jgi:hypothetical protein
MSDDEIFKPNYATITTPPWHPFKEGYGYDLILGSGHSLTNYTFGDSIGYGDFLKFYTEKEVINVRFSNIVYFEWRVYG